MSEYKDWRYRVIFYAWRVFCVCFILVACVVVMELWFRFQLEKSPQIKELQGRIDNLEAIYAED